MTSRNVCAIRGWRVSIFLFLIAAGIMLIAAVGGKQNTTGGVVVAGMFIAAAVIRWLAEPRPFELYLDNDKLILVNSGEHIPYADILAIHASRNAAPARGRSEYAMNLQWRGGEVFIPKRLNVSSRDLEDFLRERICEREAPLTGILADYLQSAIAQFGDDRVWWARGVPVPSERRVNRGLLIAAAFLLVASIGGIIAGSVLKQENLAGLSGFAMLFGLISLVCALVPMDGGGHPKVKRMGEATVAITPLGLALTQGDMHGEASWDEIKQVQLLTKPPSFALTRGGVTRGIDITLAGAKLRILDIYDRSIEEMHEWIMAYWQ